MKIQIDQVVRDAEGDVLLQDLRDAMGNLLPEHARPQVTLKTVSIISILAPVKEDEEQAKMLKYEIWKKLKDATEEVDLKAEEITLLKKVIAKFQPQLIMGQCFEMIEK